MRVVPEAMRTARLLRDDALELAARLHEHRAVRRGEAHGAHEPRLPTVRRHAAHRFHQLGVVARIALRARARSAGPVRAVDTRRALQCVHLEPAVVGQHRLAQRRRVVAGLDARVLLERVARLVGLGRHGPLELGQRHHRESHGRKHCADLVHLVRVAGCDHDAHAIPPAAQVCRTPVRNGWSTGAWYATRTAARSSARVRDGSMIRSSQPRLAA